MSGINLRDEVIYDGENKERVGQKADVVMLLSGDLIELEFADEDDTGSKRLVTTRDNVAVTSRRLTIGFAALVDDGRVTDVDKPS